MDPERESAVSIQELIDNGLFEGDHGTTAGGKAITEALIKDLAARAEFGYSVTRTLVGRTPIVGGSLVNLMSAVVSPVSRLFGNLKRR